MQGKDRIVGKSYLIRRNAYFILLSPAVRTFLPVLHSHLTQPGLAVEDLLFVLLHGPPEEGSAGEAAGGAIVRVSVASCLRQTLNRPSIVQFLVRINPSLTIEKSISGFCENLSLSPHTEQVDLFSSSSLKLLFMLSTEGRLARFEID